MASNLRYDVHPYLVEDMPVEVIRGPLQGVRGIFLRKAKPYRLVISIKLIQQAAAVEIDADDVISLSPNDWPITSVAVSGIFNR